MREFTDLSCELGFEPKAGVFYYYNFLSIIGFKKISQKITCLTIEPVDSITVVETLSRVYLAALSIFAQSIPDMPRFAHVQQMLKNRKLRIPPAAVSPVSTQSSVELSKAELNSHYL